MIAKLNPFVAANKCEQ